MSRSIPASGTDAPPAGNYVPGAIRQDEVYTLQEARARLRWSDATLRAAKRRGLRLWKCGKYRYLAGSELFRFLEHSNQPNSTNNP